MKSIIKGAQQYLLEVIVYFKLFRSFIVFDVTITGGFGSQLISVSALSELSNIGYHVNSNTDYFTKPYNLDFNITQFDLDPFIVNKLPKQEVKGPRLTIKLHDTPLKFSLGLRSIVKNKESIRNDLLPLSSAVQKIDHSKPTIVIHVRRGDFLAVADFVKPISEQIKTLSDNIIRSSEIILLTDSPKLVKNELAENSRSRKLLKKSKILGPEDTNIYDVIEIMTTADILVASNSQLSLVASILNPNIIVFDVQNFVKDKRYLKKLKNLTKGVCLWHN